MAILQSKIQNNSSFRNRKSILKGDCRSENHSPILLPSCNNPKSEADFDMGFPVSHAGIIVEILSATLNLDVITSLSEEVTLIFFLQKRLTYSAKNGCEVLSSR